MKRHSRHPFYMTTKSSHTRKSRAVTTLETTLDYVRPKPRQYEHRNVGETERSEIEPYRRHANRNEKSSERDKRIRPRNPAQMQGIIDCSASTHRSKKKHCPYPNILYNGLIQLIFI